MAWPTGITMSMQAAAGPQRGDRTQDTNASTVHSGIMSEHRARRKTPHIPY